MLIKSEYQITVLTKIEANKSSTLMLLLATSNGHYFLEDKNDEHNFNILYLKLAKSNSI